MNAIKIKATKAADLKTRKIEVEPGITDQGNRRQLTAPAISLEGVEIPAGEIICYMSAGSNGKGQTVQRVLWGNRELSFPV